MTQIITPYILAAVYIPCLFAAGSRTARVRVAAVGLWLCSVAIATLVMYAADWPGSSKGWLNILWAGLVSLSAIWAVVVLKQPAPLPPTATLPPPGTYANYVPADPAPAEPRSGWVKPSKPQSESGPTRRRYEARRRRIPIVARERRKRVA